MIHSTFGPMFLATFAFGLASCSSIESPTGFTEVPVNDQPRFQIAAPSCIAPPTGLVSWWAGEGNADDAQGDNDGTVVNGATFAPGVDGDAFNFAGVADHILIPHDPSINFTENDTYTIELWVKTDVETEGHPALVEKWALPQNMPYPYVVRLNTGDPRFHGASPVGTTACASYDTVNNPAVSSITRIDDGKFHHVACIFDHPSKQLRVFVDGELDNSQTYTVLNDITNDVDLFLGVRGRLAGGINELTDFGGLLDEIKIFDRALSPGEIAATYKAGGDGICKTPDALSLLLLFGEVETLVRSGNLKESHAQRLLNELKKAIRHFEDGDSNKGCKDLEKFVTEVTKLIDQGKLAQADGQAVLDSANQIRNRACG